jgi:hypothetical protein
MTPDQFRRLLDTHGADPRHWPPDQRGEAELLCTTSPEARAHWESAQRLDALFARDRAAPGDPTREAAILDATLRRIRHLPEPSAGWRWLWRRPVGALMAATALAGWLVGLVVGPALAPALRGSDAQGVPAITALLTSDPADIEELP